MQNENSNNTDVQTKFIEPVLTIPKPRPQIQQQQQQPQQMQKQSPKTPSTSKYTELLHVIGELGQHIRPSYTGHRGSSEKIRQGIIKARALVRECLIETEKSARQ